jgi:hypothetical protein
MKSASFAMDVHYSIKRIEGIAQLSSARSQFETMFASYLNMSGNVKTVSAKTPACGGGWTEICIAMPVDCICNATRGHVL